MSAAKEIHQRSLAELASGLSAGDFSSRELTAALLARIDKHQSRLNAFITITRDEALARADLADKARENGDAVIVPCACLAAGLNSSCSKRSNNY